MSLSAHYDLIRGLSGEIHDVSGRVQHNEAAIEVIDMSLSAHYDLIRGLSGEIHDVSGRVQHNEAAIEVIDMSLAAHYGLVMSNQDTISNITSTSDKTTFFSDNSNGLVEMPALNVATTLWQPFGGDISNVQGLRSNQDNSRFKYYGRGIALSDDAQFLAVSAWATPEISNNVVDIYQYNDSEIWTKIQRIENNTSSATYHGYYMTFNTLIDNTTRLFIGDNAGKKLNNLSTGSITMYDLSDNTFIQKAQLYGDEDGGFMSLVDQKQDSYIVVGGPASDSSKTRKINIYTPEFSTRILTIIVPNSFGNYSPSDIQIDASSNYIYFTQYSSSSTSTERQDLYIYDIKQYIKNYIDNQQTDEITLSEDDNLAQQFKSIPNQSNNSVSRSYVGGLSISNNGQYIVVGKSYLQADVYHLDKETLKLVYQIYPPIDTGYQGAFAENVSMSSDGKRIAIFFNGTIPYRGGVIIYETQDYQEWHQIGNHIIGDDWNDGNIYSVINNRISLSADGQVVAIGYPFAETPDTVVDAGFARTYRLTDNTSIMRVDRDGVTFNGPLELDVLHVKDTIKFTNNNNIHMGYLAGDAAKSGSNNIRLGLNAGHDAPNASNSVAIGSYAGKYGHSSNAVAIGYFAGFKDQSSNSVAIGNEAGAFRQYDKSVAIGYWAAAQDQSSNSVAIGNRAAYTSQQHNSVAIGYQAGHYNQGPNSIAIGSQSGFHTDYGADNILIGHQSGYNGNPTILNKCVYIGNYIESKSDTQNEIILGNNIPSNMSGRGTNVMILGNDELQRIIIPSYQNLKTMKPQCDGQLYIDADNNLKVFQLPINLASQVFPLIYGVHNSFGNPNTNTSFNVNGAAIMTMPANVTMSWGAFGEENIYVEYLLNENPTHNAYQINVNIQDINVEIPTTDIIVFVKSFNDKLDEGIELIEMQEFTLQNGDNNDIILNSYLLSNNNVAYEQVGIMLRASANQAVSVQVNTGSITLINQ